MRIGKREQEILDWLKRGNRIEVGSHRAYFYSHGPLPAWGEPLRLFKRMEEKGLIHRTKGGMREMLAIGPK